MYPGIYSPHISLTIHLSTWGLNKKAANLRTAFGNRVGNSHRSAGPKPTTLEEDRKIFVDFSSILCLWFEIQAMRTYNFFDWVSNTVCKCIFLIENLWNFIQISLKFIPKASIDNKSALVQELACCMFNAEPMTSKLTKAYICTFRPQLSDEVRPINVLNSNLLRAICLHLHKWKHFDFKQFLYNILVWDIIY